MSKFPDEHELIRQIEGGYIRTDQVFDPDAFTAFMVFDMWREGRTDYQDQREIFEEWGDTFTRLDYLKLLARGCWEYLKQKYG